MGTNIFEKYGIIITRFAGGKERGICYQVNIGAKFVQLTFQEFEDFVLDLKTEYKRQWLIEAKLSWRLENEAVKRWKERSDANIETEKSHGVGS